MTAQPTRLAIVNHHGGIPAGSEKAIEQFAERLPDHVRPVFFLFEGGRFAEELERKYEVLYVRMSRRVANSTRGMIDARSIGDTLGLCLRLARALRESDIDIVLTNSVKAHFIGMPAARYAHLPCVNFIHDDLEGLPLRVLREFCRRFSVGRFACSRLVARRLNVRDTTVVHSPVDQRFFDPRRDAARAKEAMGLDVSRVTIGIVGRVAPWKGQDVFLRIAREVLARAQATFVIVGSPIFGCDPGYPTELERYVRESGMQADVRFVPWRDDLESVYAALDVVCNCSTAEPFGRTVAEAMASGRPVACFDDAGAAEIFTNQASGVQIPAGDVAAYAAALVTLIEDASKRESMGRFASEEARELHIDVLSARFNAGIDKAVTRIRRSGIQA